MLSHIEYLQLIQEVNRLRNEVHLFNIEEISESALDDLKHKISEFENLNPDKISLNSPNYFVSGGIAEGFEKYKHVFRMLSLTDIFSVEELQDWQKKWLNYLQKEDPKKYENLVKINLQNEELFKDKNENEELKTDLKNLKIEYICEPKLDGLAVSIHYQDGQLIRAVTRGDGFEGELVTENVKQIKSIPKQIKDKRSLEVRGEVFMTKKDFQELNEQIEQGHKVGKMGKTGADAKFANSRNASSGTIRQLDSRIVAGRNLSFVAYNVYFYAT
jgi:DNA ligase (NAD+)